MGVRSMVGAFAALAAAAALALAACAAADAQLAGPPPVIVEPD
jgi:hypothetical protein